MNELTTLLHSATHTLVLRTADGQVLTFDGRGISDLLRLLDNEPQTLRGATLADKVVGKAAAALMIAGGIRAVHADTISKPAMQLFAACAPDTTVSHDTVVEHIVNMQQTRWCPMELACRYCESPEECIIKIKEKLSELRKS